MGARSAPHTYTVELRIEGRDVVPSAISAQLHRQPTYAREAGELRGKTKKFEYGLWSYAGEGVGTNSERKWTSLEEGLLHVMEQLLPVHARIRSYADKFDVYWWCGHFQSSFDGGPTFSPNLLEQLAKFGFPLSLENYFSDAAHGSESELRNEAR